MVDRDVGETAIGVILDLAKSDPEAFEVIFKLVLLLADRARPGHALGPETSTT
jgi:hypothetical protein